MQAAADLVEHTPGGDGAQRVQGDLAGIAVAAPGAGQQKLQG